MTSARAAGVGPTGCGTRSTTRPTTRPTTRQANGTARGARNATAAWLAAALASMLAMATATGCSGRARVASLTREYAASVAAGDAGVASSIEARLLAAANAQDRAGDARWVSTRGDVARIAGWAGDDARAMSLATATLAAVQALAGPDSKRLVAPLETIGWLHVDAGRWSQAREVVARIVGICASPSRLLPPRSSAPAEAPAFAPDAAPDAAPDDTLDDGCGRLAGLDLALLATAAGDPRAGAAEYLRRFDDEAPPTVAGGQPTQATMVARWHLAFGDDEAAARLLQGCGTTQRLPGTADRHVGGSGDVVLSIADAAHEFDSEAPRCLDDAIALALRLGRSDEASRLAGLRRASWSAGPDLEDSLQRDVHLADARGDDPFGAADRAHALAFYRAGKGRRDDAIASLRDALARLALGDQRDGRPMHRAAAVLRIDLLLDLAGEQEAARSFAEAEAAYRRAHESASRFLHPAHAWVLDAAAGVARSVSAQGRAREAEGLWLEFTGRCRAVRGTGHVDCARGLDALAAIWTHDGRHAEAGRAAREADAARSAARRRVDAAVPRPPRPAPTPEASRPAPPSGSTAPGPALPPPPSPAIQRPPRNASRWNAAERSSYPWPRSPFAETPSTSPARCRRSATPPPTST